ncbi:hypothetical protein GCM10009596_30210 [Arthrobacter rhombi]|uniref:helix-turn-helix domain-containing protein n=1 Tax=Arthrobacter rhombi TaxID=71253 RepID=UPI0031E35749
MDLLTTNEVAKVLGMAPAAVRRLASSGRLPSAKIGASLAFEPAGVYRMQREDRKIGRVWSAATAWAAIEMLSGMRTEIIDQPRRSRLAAKIQALDAAEFHRLARQRSAVRRFHASPRASTRLAGLIEPSGVMAVAAASRAARFGLAGVRSESRIEGYWTGRLEDLLSTVPLRPDAGGNVVIRLAEEAHMKRAIGTDVLVALDLMDSDDVRERGAGRNVLEEYLHHVH